MNKDKYYNFVIMNRCYGKTYHELLKEIKRLKEVEEDHHQANAILMQELTNLQQENERLNNLFEYNMQTLVNTDKLLEDYKSRCEKAIEYIEKHSNSFSVLDTISNSDLLNILQGSEDK